MNSFLEFFSSKESRIMISDRNVNIHSIQLLFLLRKCSSIIMAQTTQSIDDFAISIRLITVYYFKFIFNSAIIVNPRKVCPALVYAFPNRINCPEVQLIAVQRWCCLCQCSYYISIHILRFLLSAKRNRILLITQKR